MTGYLVDTNILSELQKARSNPGVVQWFEEIQPTQVFISVLTLGEIERGITRLRSRDRTRAEQLSAWTTELELNFADRIVPVDAAVAECWGQLSADRTRPVVDTLIAATAAVHGMVLVTRNLADFSELPIHLHNPFS